MTKLQRQRDWRTRLRNWADAQVGSSFQWGTTDCGSLACQALIEMFGDSISAHLPFWHTARGALWALRDRGKVGDQLMALGAQKISLPFLRAGDIIVAEESEEEVGRVAIMICIDARECLASTHDGVVWSEPPESCEVYSLWEMTHG